MYPIISGEVPLGFMTIILYTTLFILLTTCIAMEAYCVKCKSKRSMKDEKKVTMKNGKPATQGICSICGTKMFKIGKWSLTLLFWYIYLLFILQLWLSQIFPEDQGIIAIYASSNCLTTIRNLVKWYENLIAVDGLHLDIREN